MQRVVGFYSKLPRGQAPEPLGKGIVGWYRKKYFGKNASAARKDCPHLGSRHVIRTLDSYVSSSSYCSCHRRLDDHRLRSKLLLPLA